MSLKEIRYYYFYAVRYYAISGSDVSESRTFVDSIRTSLDSVARKRASEIMAHLRYHDKNFSRVISVDVYKSSEQDATLALASLDNSKIIYSARNFDVKQPTPPKKSVFEKLDDYFSNNQEETMSKRNDDIDSKIFKSTVAVIVFSILTIIGGIIAWPTLIFTVPFIAFQIWLLVNEIRERDKMNK